MISTKIINEFRNQRRALDDLTEVQKMLYSTVKRWLPASEIDNRNISLFGQKSSVFLTQMERRNRVQSESQSQMWVFNLTNMNSKVLLYEIFYIYKFL